MRRLHLLVGLALLAGSVRFAGDAQAVGRSVTGLRIGNTPPSFSAADLNGKTQTLENHKGKVVVLHFWATWCPYCRTEIPELVELHTRWASKGVAVISVSGDEDVAALTRFVQRANLPYPVIADVQARVSIAQRYNVSGIPVTYIIAEDGTIADYLAGSSEIIEAVEAVLGKG